MASANDEYSGNVAAMEDELSDLYETAGWLRKGCAVDDIDRKFERSGRPVTNQKKRSRSAYEETILRPSGPTMVKEVAANKDSGGCCNWSDLPNDVIELLLKQSSSSLLGFLRFGAVCKAWQSVSKDTTYRPPQVPWLLLLCDENPEILSFFSPWEEKVYNVYLPGVEEKNCWASWRSWLITRDYFSYDISLLNPLSRIAIQLPQLPKDHCYQQIALSSSSTPSHPQNVWGAAMVTLSHRNIVRFCRPGDETWTEIDSVGLGYYHDLVSCKGKFYLVDAYGTVSVCDVHACPPQVTELPEIPLLGNVSPLVKYYLLESCGELFFILRLFRIYPSKTNEFRVFKLDDVSGSEWIQVESLGDRAFFLATDGTYDKDNSGSIDISTDYDGRKNCIYFVEEDTNIGCEQLGKFALDGKTITYSIPADDDSSWWLSGLWVKPNPWQEVPCDQ